MAAIVYIIRSTKGEHKLFLNISEPYAMILEWHIHVMILEWHYHAMLK